MVQKTKRLRKGQSAKHCSAATRKRKPIRNMAEARAGLEVNVRLANDAAMKSVTRRPAKRGPSPVKKKRKNSPAANRLTHVQRTHLYLKAFH